MWEPQVEHLAARYRVVRYDCRGFGASGPFDPAAPYTHAADLVALLDHLAIGQAVLAGLSFGGRVVLQTALAAPARVAGLVLLDAVLDGVPWDPESADALGEPPGGSRRAEPRPGGRPGWLTRCSPPRASGRSWRPSWRPWSPATPASTGSAVTRTGRSSGRPSRRWRTWPRRRW